MTSASASKPTEHDCNRDNGTSNQLWVMSLTSQTSLTFSCLIDWKLRQFTCASWGLFFSKLHLSEQFYVPFRSPLESLAIKCSENRQSLVKPKVLFFCFEWLTGICSGYTGALHTHIYTDKATHLKVIFNGSWWFSAWVAVTVGNGSVQWCKVERNLTMQMSSNALPYYCVKTVLNAELNFKQYKNEYSSFLSFKLHYIFPKCHAFSLIFLWILFSWSNFDIQKHLINLNSEHFKNVEIYYNFDNNACTMIIIFFF